MSHKGIQILIDSPMFILYRQCVYKPEKQAFESSQINISHMKKSLTIKTGKGKYR